MRTFSANFIAEKNRRAQGPAPRNLLSFGFATPVLLSDRDIAHYVETGGNLLANGDMELDSGWTSVSVAELTNTRSSEQAHSGTYSRKLVGSPGEGMASAAFATTAALDYRFTGWFYSPTLAAIRIGILDGSGNTISDSEPAITAGAWSQVTIDYTETDTGIDAQVFILLPAGSQATVYADDLSLQALVSELVTNGDMELDSGWVDLNSPTANVRSSAQAHGGTYSRKFTSRAVQNDGIKSSTYSLVAADYVLEFWVYTSASAVKIYLWDGLNAIIVSGEGHAVTPDTWTKITRNFTAAEVGSAGAVAIGASLPAGATDYYIDDVSVVLAGSAELLTNGDMELDASWTSMPWPALQNTRTNESTHGGTYSRKLFYCFPNEGIYNAAGFTTSPGQCYRLTGWVKSTTQTAIRLRVRDGGDTATISEAEYAITAAAWSQVSVDYTETVGGIAGKVYLLGADGEVGGYYLDDFTLVALTPVLDYLGLVKSWGFVDSSAGQGPNRSIIGSFDNADLSLTITNSESPSFAANSTTADPIEGVEVELSQWFADLELNEAEVLFKGTVTGQPDYDLDEYRLTIRGIWEKYNRLIGGDWLLTEADHPGLDPDDVGKMANLAYGQLLNVPVRAVAAGAVDCLATTVTSGSTTIVLVDASKFTTTGTIGWDAEQSTYTGKSGNSLTGVTRAANGTTAAAHTAGAGVFQIASEYVYQLAKHPVKAIRDLYVGKFKVTASATFYTGQTGSVKTGYTGQAVATLPASITRTAAATLLVANGMASADATAAVAAIPGSANVTISDTVELFNVFGVGTGNHFHTGPASSTKIPTSAEFVNNIYDDWTNSESTVRDQSDATYVSGQVIGDGPFVTSCKANFSAYDGSTPSAVYLCVRHKSYTSNQVNGSVKVGSDTLAYAADYTTYGTMQPLVQKFYAGTSVPTSFQVDVSSDNSQLVYTTIYEMWMEVHATNTGTSPATGVTITMAASVTRASAKAVASQGGTVTRSGVCNLSGNSVAEVEIGGGVAANFDGQLDDASGTITGTAYGLIERPDHVYKHLLLTYCGFPSAEIGGSFATAGTFYNTNSYAFALLLNQPVWADDLFPRLDLQCRSRFLVTPAGEARLLVRQLGQSSGHHIVKNEIVRGSMSMRRSCADDIVNNFTVLYNQDHRKSGAEAFMATTQFTDATSVSRYGTREPASAELFHFNAVRSAAMASSVGTFWLDFLKVARRMPSFSVFLDNLEVEPGDIISVTHPLDGMTAFVCEVLKVRYVLGSGRDKRMDTMEILAVEN